MRSARLQFILLGMLCQAVSWDNFLLPLASIFLWIACIQIGKHRPLHLGPLAEIALLISGAALGYAAGRALGQSVHFFIGHGLTLVQAARLLRPLNEREKLFSVFIAFVQLGVGCTIVLDYRFLFILAAAGYLVPKVFLEMQMERHCPVAGAHLRSTTAPAVPLRHPTVIAYAVIALASALFFIVFPRGLLGSSIQTHRIGSRGEGTLVDSLLDPASGGFGQSGRILMQIEGENLGNLRCYALTEFKNGIWSGNPKNALSRLRFAAGDLTAYPLRRARVKDVRFLGKVLPSDGPMVFLEGKFFRQPFVNADGIIECGAMWDSASSLYEFRIDPAKRQPLSPRERARLLVAPEPSARLRQWLDDRVGGISVPVDKVRALEAYFRENFTYRLGAPELSRVNSLEDFLFARQEGHCERFASAMALLCRTLGLPSRIVVGYVPGDKNWMSGWHNIRFRDGHAWVETYFEDRGWVPFDATPRSIMAPTNWYLRDLADAIDVIWYLHIINYDGAAQKELLARSLTLAASTLAVAASKTPWILGILLLGWGIRHWRSISWLRRKEQKPAAETRTRAAIQAGHFYGQMLEALAARGIEKQPQQTPHEFAAALPSDFSERREDVSLITQVFCASRYGRLPLSAAQEQAVRTALSRLHRQKPEKMIPSIRSCEHLTRSNREQ